jgi:putative endonuclease
MYLVYILKCADSSLYIGSTNNLEKRLHEHNNLKSGAHYTKIRRPVELVYTEDVGDLSSARKKEAAMKKLPREEKLALVASKNKNEIL